MGRSKGWLTLQGAVVGAALAGGLAAWYSESEGPPEEAFVANAQGPPPKVLRKHRVDAVLVIDAVICGLLLGAAAGAYLGSERPVPRGGAVSAPESDDDGEAFRAELRRRVAARVNLTSIPDDEYPAVRDALRAELLAVAEQLSEEVPTYLGAVETTAAVPALVSEMLATYERNRSERLAMGRPRRGTEG